MITPEAQALRFASPQAQDDYLTVTMLAAGLAAILRRRASPGAASSSADGLLPPPWRIAFSRLWWTFATQSKPPLASDLELLEWCTVPFSGWPVSLDLSEDDLQQALLASDTELSDLAEQAARIGSYDVEAEWMERRVFDALKTAARRNSEDEQGAQEGYAYLRRYLIDAPVISDNDVRALERRYRATDNNGQTYIQHLIDVAYVSRPASGVVPMWRCRNCRNPLPEPGGACGTAGCRLGEAEQFTVNALAAIYVQHRGTRRYIHDPGLVEARIIDLIESQSALSGRVKVTAYPGMDLLDILIEFLEPGPDGELQVMQTWGVDAKDQSSARILGRGFAWPKDIECDRRIIALPMHRARTPDYMATLRAELEGRVAVDVMDEDKLLTLVAAEAERLSA